MLYSFSKLIPVFLYTYCLIPFLCIDTKYAICQSFALSALVYNILRRHIFFHNFSPTFTTISVVIVSLPKALFFLQFFNHFHYLVSSRFFPSNASVTCHLSISFFLPYLSSLTSVVFPFTVASRQIILSIFP